MSDVSPPPVRWKYDYVQAGKPADAEEGESWYDVDGDRALVFTDDSGGTRELTVTEHAQLAGITRDAHHNPVSVEGPMRLSSGQVLDLAAADGLTLDADGRLRVAASSVTEAMLGFDVATQGELDDHASDADAHHDPMPSGVITMWSGSASNVPSGWTLCDGSDGTPDLRGRFVVGAGGSYASGDTGGSEQVQLSEDEIASHAHTVEWSESDYGTGSTTSIGSATSEYDPDTAMETTSSGGDQPHENRPPYYALAFIMKV